MISKYIFRFSGQAEFSTPRQTFHGSQCSVFGLTHRPVSDSVKRNISSRTEVKKNTCKNTSHLQKCGVARSNEI